MSKALLITGAAGFLGRALVRAARAEGREVIAQVRRRDAAPLDWTGDAGIRVAACDLADDPAAIEPLLEAAGCVIHAAAAMHGDDAHHARQTIAPTRHIVALLSKHAPRTGLVLVSSLAVHDALAIAPGSMLDEDAPLEADGARRDAYCRAKIEQERILQAAHGVPRMILRPGVLYAGRAGWNDHLGLRLGPLTLALSRGGEVPMCHRDACAAALLLAADQTREGRCPSYLLVDDALPGRCEFLDALRRQGEIGPVLALPFAIGDALARVVAPLPGLPGLMRRPVLHARMKPLRYSNARAGAALGWRPARYEGDGQDG